MDENFVRADISSGKAFQSEWLNCTFSELKAGMLDIRAARVIDCTFTKGALYGSVFSGSYLRNVTFTDCDFEQATFSGTIFDNVVFSECNMAYSTLAGSIARRTLRFHNCNLHGADLDIAEASDNGLSIHGCNLWGARLSLGCAFWNAEFDQTTVDRFIAMTARACPDSDKAKVLRDLSGASTGARVGAHLRHLTGTTYRATAIACTECHTYPPGGVHPVTANGPAQMNFGALARNATWGGVTPAPSYDGANCSSEYCHGAFRNGKSATPSWTASGLDCNSCHGTGRGAVATLPPAPHPQSNSNCAVCHQGYTSSSVDPATHIDGALDVRPQICDGCHGDAGRSSAIGVGFASGPVELFENRWRGAPPVDTQSTTGCATSRTCAIAITTNWAGCPTSPRACCARAS